jgi:hypothetical protein
LNTIRQIIPGKIKASIVLALSINSFKAQDLIYKSSNIGINIGANLAIGSHFQRLGINFNLFYVNYFFQSNTEIRAYISFKNLGPKKIHTEMALAQGIVFAGGPKQNYFNPFINSASNQTGYIYAFAYSYNAYFNRIKTKQQTGIISLQFDKVSVIIENDILARPVLDRFRTGAFLIQYQHSNVFQAALNCTMWTGAMGKSVRGDNNFPAGCYVDTTGGTYTNYSHGLLSAQFKYNTGYYSQIAQANIGIDAEQVRNVVQNKLIHDAAFLPKSWFKRNNCHIPMLDDQGDQYLFKPGQKIKKPGFYWNLFGNPNLFY